MIDSEKLIRLVQFFDVGAAVVFALSLPVLRESVRRERWTSEPKDP